MMRTLSALVVGLLFPAYTLSWTADAAPTRYRLEVPSADLEVTLQQVPCEELPGPLTPAKMVVYYGDCSTEHGFYGVIGRDDGPLEPLATASAGTLVRWWDGKGAEFSRRLTGIRAKSYPYPDGSWPGHGVPPGNPLYIDLRGDVHQTERQGNR